MEGPCIIPIHRPNVPIQYTARQGHLPGIVLHDCISVKSQIDRSDGIAANRFLACKNL
jgi:hypothetical protein